MIANKTANIVLCISQQACLLSHWSGAKLQYFQAYQHAEEVDAALRQYLLQHRAVPISLLIDTMAEDYQFEMLPHITGRSRQAVLARKLKQFGRDSIYKTASFLYSKKTTRKEDCYVFFAFTNMRFCQHYLSLLKADTLLLAGIYALPMVSQKMLPQRRLGLTKLLFCECLSSGFRQTFILHQGIRFSRLTPMSHQQSVQSSAFCLAEIEKMRAYLLSQRMIADDTVLPIVMSTTRDMDKQLIAALNQHPWFTYQPLSLGVTGGLDAAALNQYPELQHMQALATANRPANLAPKAETQHHDMKQLANRLTMLSAAVMAVGVCAALYLLLQGYQEKAQLPPLTKQTAQLLKQQNNLHYPAAPVPATDLKTAVSIAKAINQDSPLRLMQAVSTALDAVPEVTLNRIRWLQTNQQQIQDKNHVNILTVPSAHNGANQAMHLNQIGFVQIEIQQPPREHHDVTVITDQFVTALRSQSQIQRVQLLQSSDLERDGKRFVGSTEDVLNMEAMPASFSLMVTMQPTGQNGD